MTVAHSPVHSYVHLPVHSHSPVWTLENDSIISGGGEAPLWLKLALLAWILSPELRRYLILKAAVLWTGTSERRLGHNALGWALSQRRLLVHGHLFPASLLLLLPISCLLSSSLSVFLSLSAPFHLSIRVTAERTVACGRFSAWHFLRDTKCGSL